MITGLPNQSDLELEIQLSKIYYGGSHEKIRINKIRSWIFQITFYTCIGTYLALATYFVNVVKVYYPSATSQMLMDYMIVVMVIAFALSTLLSFVVVRDKSWSHIFLHYNRGAVEAADQAGSPLIPPSPTTAERERNQQEAIADLARVATFSLSDYALFGATALIVYGIAFKQDINVLLGTILILSTKFRLMLYGIARLGPWQGTLMYLGATIAIIAVFAYADGDVWKRLSFSL